MFGPAQQWMLCIGAILGFLAVAVGAFAAHALKQRIHPDMLAIFEVGARYHMYHVLAIGLALWASTVVGGWSMAAGWCFIGGIVVFSGSLYILALSGVTAWGAVTPIGGVMFLIGWVLLAISAFNGKVV